MQTLPDSGKSRLSPQSAVITKEWEERRSRSHFSHFNNGNENTTLSMTRNKTEAKTVGSIFRSGAKRDQQFHFVYFLDLLLFFRLSVAELPGGTAHYSQTGMSLGLPAAPPRCIEELTDGFGSNCNEQLFKSPQAE